VVFFIVGALQGDEGPESGRVVEFFEVAKFVDDKVILCGRFKEEDFIGKIEVTFRGTAAPAGFRIFDENFVVGKIVVAIEI
jgi:hypothetical protein